MKTKSKFCPNPKSNQTELKRDLKEFEWKFRLIDKLHNKNYRRFPGSRLYFICESNGNEGVLHTSQISRKRASPSDSV